VVAHGKPGKGLTGSGARGHARVRKRRPLGLARGLYNDPVDEARQIADSYGADTDDLDSRALAVAFTLADDVSEKALLVESLATVAHEAVLWATPAYGHRRPLGLARGVRHDPGCMPPVKRLPTLSHHIA
ncbi:unnamed protein product, partial [Ectocarpus sp. 6 AP-2014]